MLSRSYGYSDHLIVYLTDWVGWLGNLPFNDCGGGGSGLASGMKLRSADGVEGRPDARSKPPVSRRTRSANPLSRMELSLKMTSVDHPAKEHNPVSREAFPPTPRIWVLA